MNAASRTSSPHTCHPGASFVPDRRGRHPLRLADVRNGLAALVDGGEDAESMVTILLYLLSESEAGHALERRPRRQILAAWKKLSVDEGTVAVVRQVQEAWAASRS